MDMQMEPVNKMHKFVIFDYSIVLLLFHWQELGHLVETKIQTAVKETLKCWWSLVSVNLDDDGTVIRDVLTATSAPLDSNWISTEQLRVGALHDRAGNLSQYMESLFMHLYQLFGSQYLQYVVE